MGAIEYRAAPVSLLSRLLLLIALVVAPAVALEAWRSSEERHEEQLAIITRAQHLATLVATEQRRIVDGAHQLLTALSLLRSVRQRDEPACAETLRRAQQEFPIYTSLGVTDAEGRIWCSSAAPGADISSRPGFQAAVATRQFAIGSYVPSNATERPALTLILPLRDEERGVFGALSAELSLDRLAQELAETPRPNGATLTIADSTGRVLVDLPTGAAVGQLLPPHLRSLVRADHVGAIDTEWLDGVRQVVGYVPAEASPAPNFLVTLGLDHGNAIASIQQEETAAWMKYAAVLAAAMLAAWWFAIWFIRRPLARLTAVAERWRHGDLTARTGLRDHGSEMGRLGLAFDAMAEAVAEREKRLRDVLESTTDVVFTLDRGWRFTFLNARATTLFADGPARFGRNIWDAFPDAFDAPFARACHRAMEDRVPTQVTFFYDPLRRFFEAHAFPAQNGGITVFGRDVTEQHRAEEALRRLAYSDALTGLANRTRLRELLGLAMVRPAPAALLLLDLDGFKHVNDSMGHGAGDVVLRDVATRLASRLGDRGTLARLGADEFAMLLPGVDSAAEAEAIAGELLAALAADPFRTGGRMFHIGASIGLVFVPLGFGTDPDVVMANADLALFRAKAVGGGACQTFDTGIRQEYEVRRLLEEDIGRAVASGEFELHYQPQVRLADGALVGAEALLRWRHPTRGLLSPSLFLEALETSPHACAVGYWIIDEACQQAAAWRADGLTLRIGINLFGEQLRAGGLAEKIEAILARWALPPEMLELELTENIALRHEQGMLAPLRILRARGVGIAFDDFGTGFASLTMLKDFPLTRLKIDRGFIASLPEGAHDAAIVDALLALGRNLSLEVIAEGIETAAQAEFLAARGCSEGQGYLFSRPLPPEAFTVAFSPRGSHAGMVEFSWARGG